MATRRDESAPIEEEAAHDGDAVLSDDGVASDKATPPSSPREECLSERFASICQTTPLPNHQRANLPGATEAELEYLVQNDSGEIFMSPDAIWKNDDTTRPTIMAAMCKAMKHVCKANGVDLVLPIEAIDDATETQVKDGDADVENEAKASEDVSEGESPPTVSKFQPLPELRTLTWANSEAKKVIDAFNEETERIRAERAAKEAEEEAALMAHVPQAAKKPAPTKPAFTEDPVLWAAQEEAAASSVMRDLRARNKKTMWGSRSTKLKPEAAAEMARARVAAAAAAAVMRNESRGGELVRAPTLDSIDVLERFARGTAGEGGFYPMHAQAFQRAHHSGPGGKKKKVAFAAGTVFARKK